MNTRFSTYASYWIKQSIKRALVNTAKTIRIPAYMVELLAKWRRASSKLQDELGRPPTHEEVAKSLNLPKKKLAIIKKAIRVYNSARRRSRPTPAGRSTRCDGRQLEVAGPRDGRVGRSQARPASARQDGQARGDGSPDAIRLDNEEPKTLKEIGESLGLTRERVRQIESEALGKLSESMQAGL